MLFSGAFLKVGWLTGQNDIGTIKDKIASVIAVFPFIISSLNDPKEGGWLATQSTLLDPPLLLSCFNL